ncbi:hypothetical protein [Natronorubrum halophilum]|uniref:hypothetical protein n=1 Tax=Natronorubrum halophilum TaxID=1702106 RepID=UPI000EF743D9|nr:hypothetical protein [Natronorubrum halophilum]
MSNSHRCPLCTETHDERAALRVHLEVKHRKSEIVTHLVEAHCDIADTSADSDRAVSDEDRPMPSAD